MPSFHYTSRKAAQDILCSSQSCLLPGKSGKIFLTPTRYAIGHQAAAKLAILNEVEIGCSISEDALGFISGMKRVDEIRDPDGSIRRQGGGLEITTTESVVIKGDDWFLLNEP